VSARVTVNPDLAAEAASSDRFRGTLMQLGEQVGADAEGLAAQYKYTSVVVDNGDSVQVQGSAHGQGIENIAGWVEFGADGKPGIPAVAPLRNAAEANGLRLKAAR